MGLKFILPENESFVIGYALPASYRGRILRGGKVLTATSNAGTLIVQTYEHPLFTIHFKEFNFFQNISLEFQQKAARIISFLALKSNIQYQAPGVGSIKLTEGQFSMLQLSEAHLKADFEKNKTYHSLEIAWSSDIVQEGLPLFPSLSSLIDAQNFANAFIGRPSYPAGADVMGLANDILHSPYEKDVSAMLFEYKVREYFLLIMVAVGKMPVSKISLTQIQWNKIDEIAQMLRDNPGKKYSINTLASHAHMNTMKFKQAFKERYDSGAFEYQMAQRMQEALEILEQGTMNTKEVAAYIGYKGLGSFITKFREYHGFPPGKVKRKP